MYLFAPFAEYFISILKLRNVFIKVLTLFLAIIQFKRSLKHLFYFVAVVKNAKPFGLVVMCTFLPWFLGSEHFKTGTSETSVLYFKYIFLVRLVFFYPTSQNILLVWQL